MPGKVNPWARADEDDDDEENTPVSLIVFNSLYLLFVNYLPLS